MCSFWKLMGGKEHPAIKNHVRQYPCAASALCVNSFDGVAVMLTNSEGTLRRVTQQLLKLEKRDWEL